MTYIWLEVIIESLFRWDDRHSDSPTDSQTIFTDYSDWVQTYVALNLRLSFQEMYRLRDFDPMLFQAKPLCYVIGVDMRENVDQRWMPEKIEYRVQQTNTRNTHNTEYTTNTCIICSRLYSRITMACARGLWRLCKPVLIIYIKCMRYKAKRLIRELNSVSLIVCELAVIARRLACGERGSTVSPTSRIFYWLLRILIFMCDINPRHQNRALT